MSTSSDQIEPVRLGIAGLGGYAGAIRTVVTEHGPRSHPQIKLAAACDPDRATHTSLIADLRDAGVSVYDDFHTMLEHDGLDAVWLPVPIELHRPFAEAALAAGKAVMVEKPVAATVDDLLAMQAAERKAGLPVAVGFQDVYDATTLPAKQALLDGRIGTVQSASVWCCWPRDTVYFSRNSWAGRVRRPARRGSDGGAPGPWILDSPINNAMAHFVNITLFLLGPDLASGAQLTALRGELYRAADIENYDTVSARATLDRGIDFSILMTHACAQQHQPVIRIVGDQGVLVHTVDDVQITSNGTTETLQRDGSMRARMVERFAKAVRGVEDGDTAIATLETSLAHARLVSALSQHFPVVAVPNADVRRVESRSGGAIAAIPGIEEAFDQAGPAGQMLHETGRFGFTSPSETVDLTDYNAFEGVHPGTLPQGV